MHDQSLAKRLTMSCALARQSHVSAVAMAVSKSLARRRSRLNQAKLRSTTQRRLEAGGGSFVADRLTICAAQWQAGLDQIPFCVGRVACIPSSPIAHTAGERSRSTCCDPGHCSPQVTESQRIIMAWNHSTLLDRVFKDRIWTGRGARRAWFRSSITRTRNLADDSREPQREHPFHVSGGAAGVACGLAGLLAQGRTPS